MTAIRSSILLILEYIAMQNYPSPLKFFHFLLQTRQEFISSGFYLIEHQEHNRNMERKGYMALLHIKI